MKRPIPLLAVAAVLIACSALLYGFHYLVFRNAHHIGLFLIGDLAFVPLEVLLVAVVIERLISRHEKMAMLDKMNMPIGTFFSELGMDLLGRLTDALTNRDELRPYLAVSADWSPRDYTRALAALRRVDFQLDPALLDLAAVRDLLNSQRDLLLALLANPNLLEHEELTDLLWAVFHLLEELDARPSLVGLPQTDLDHLVGDARRAYVHLTESWLRYCEHLQTAYPYIFSIRARTHPLQDRPDATIRQ